MAEGDALLTRTTGKKIRGESSNLSFSAFIMVEIAQRVERLAVDQEVTGSEPVFHPVFGILEGWPSGCKAAV